ncbi:methyltransferase, FkbM family [Sulfitobacter brevis]|uniref:Methyltransferase, FkbM family n=1 Tax=Sulfitobacter brevis TaxID=74348 RepID=A0A1I2CH39_9RHOB|nr:FkbM family methyltransferase [Sulfitobacter brevis]SFE67641.1 methyltransferase, FkbM family [Sulfitobacter brevis]
MTAEPQSDATAVSVKLNYATRGMKFPNDPEIIRGRVRKLLRNNQYELKETDAVLRIVKEGDVVMELGAGIGYMSTLVATKRAIKSVHSFEANPNLIPYIQSVHAANGVTNATVTNAVLGKRKGKVDFYVRDDLLGSSMTVLEGEIDPPGIKVDVLNTRQVMKDIAPNVLICDIEGAEVDLIPEMDLTGLRAAVIELHPQWIGPEGVNKVFRAFMEAGLAYYHRGSQGKVVCFRSEW